VAGLVALIGVVSGWMAMSRNARDGAVAALVLGLVGTFLAGLHLVTTAGAGFGTGNGRAGAIVALVLGLIGIVLGRLTIVRSSRAPDAGR
jgi:uncharacterized membrane protein YeaQ/YmgE (transglycosylase-associated protein family)